MNKIFRRFMLHLESGVSGLGFAIRACIINGRFNDTKEWWTKYLYELERAHWKTSIFIGKIYENDFIPSTKLLDTLDELNEWIWETHKVIESFN